MKATETYLILCQMDAGEIKLQEAHELILRLFGVSGMCSGCDWIDIDYKVRKCVKCGKTEQFD